MHIISRILEYILIQERRLSQRDRASALRRAERQSARMLKITNDGLTRSVTGCLIAV